MSKIKYKKAIKSLDKRIAEHKEKQKFAKSQEQFHYWEEEIQKFKREKRKRQERL
jgi:predicted  nucleic acid-binding Zn-ribbon protein